MMTFFWGQDLRRGRNHDGGVEGGEGDGMQDDYVHESHCEKGIGVE